MALAAQIQNLQPHPTPPTPTPVLVNQGGSFGGAEGAPDPRFDERIRAWVGTAPIEAWLTTAPVVGSNATAPIKAEQSTAAISVVVSTADDNPDDK